MNLPPPPGGPPSSMLPPPPTSSGGTSPRGLSPPNLPPLPPSFPPPSSSGTSPSPRSLPPPPDSPSSSGPESPKKALDKKAQKEAEKKAKADEKERKKKEKEKEKEEKKAKEKEKKSKDKDKDKNKDKEKEKSKTSSSSDDKKLSEEEEDAAFSAQFDKASFMYNRCKNFPAPDQLEGRYRMNTGSWHDRYMVLYCDFILYYESKGSGPPKDFDKPLGALQISTIAFRKIKDFEERMDVSGLIPKTIAYDHCFECPIIKPDGKEQMALLQFDREETKTQWREKIKSQAKNIDAVKSKVTPELRTTIEFLINKYPMSVRLKEAPYPGEEERWIAVIKDHMNIRDKHRKDLRRAQLFSDFYIPNFKAYIDWFVTSGGEAGVASLEKDLMIAEDVVVHGWKKEFSQGFDVIDAETDTVEKDKDQALNFLLLKIQRKRALIKFHILYHHELYPQGRDIDDFAEIDFEWQSRETLVQDMIDTLTGNRNASAAAEQRRLEEESKQMAAERIRREEERRNDPFGTGEDDDPFADTKVVGV